MVRDFSKNMINNDIKPFHSNAFAKIASGDRLGSVSNESFEKRQEINQNRRIVYGYDRSNIGTRGNVTLAKPNAAPTTSNTVVTPSSMSLQEFNSKR